MRLIRSSFGFAMPNFMPEHRLYANDLAGGGILDVGGYPVSMARLIAGAADGAEFLDPAKVFGVGHLGESGVDEWASAVLHFPNDIIAEVSCSISLNQDNMLRILGTKGRIEVKDFWFAGGHKGGTGADTHRPSRWRAKRSKSTSPAGSTPSRSTRPARRSRPAVRNSPGPA